MSNMTITMMRSRLKTTSKVQAPTKIMVEVASKQAEAEDKVMKITMKSQEEDKEEVPAERLSANREVQPLISTDEILDNEELVHDAKKKKKMKSKLLHKY